MILCGKLGAFEFGLWVVLVIFARKVVFQIPIYFRSAGETMAESWFPRFENKGEDM